MGIPLRSAAAFSCSPARTAPGVAGRANARIGYQSLAVIMVEAIKQLDRPLGQPGLPGSNVSLLPKQPGRSRMGRIRLGDDGITCRNRRGKIATRNTAEGKRKVVRAKHHDRTDGGEPRPDVQGSIDRRQSP